MGLFSRSSSRVNSNQPIATSLRVQSSVQGQPIAIVHGQQRVAGNLIWYGNFSYTSGSGGGKGGKGGVLGGGNSKGAGSASGGANYTASFALGLCEGPALAVLDLWNNKTPQSLASQGFSVFNGFQGQAPWTYLTATDPSQAIGYSSLGYTAVPNYSLGNQPELPNFNFEVLGAVSGAVYETFAIGGAGHNTFTPSYFSLANSTVEYITIPATPYQYQAQNYTAATALPVILGHMVNPVGAPSSGVIDTLGNVFQVVGSSPATGQYAVSASGLYTFAAADAGRQVIIIDLAVGPGVYTVVQPTGTLTSGNTTVAGVSSVSGIAAGQLITATGIPVGTVVVAVGSTTLTLSQAATASAGGVTLTCWGAPFTQVAYPPVAASGQFSVLATSGSYGQYVFAATNAGTTVGIVDVPDAAADQSLTDYLTNPRYGVGFPSVNLGSLTTLRQYTFANGLFISPVFTQQQSGQAYLEDFSLALNGEFVWSGGLLTWQPYGDTTATGNGYTYTPPAAPVYSLGDDDFLKNQGTASVGVSAFTSEDPVVGNRVRQSDAYNDIKVEYLDRGNSYNPAIVEAKNDAEINAFGLRPQDTKALHLFCSIQSALTSAHLQLGRQTARNKYTITVPWYYILLDPMDVIAITDVGLGLNNQWVRILEIAENQQDFSLTMTVEEYLTGTGAAPLYGTQVKAGYAPNYNADPGQAIAPIVFEAPVQIATNNGLEMWLVTGGGANFGGCDVYMSTDNQTYKLFDRYQGSSRVGVNYADLPVGSDPDTTDTLRVTLSTVGELYSATSTSDVDLGHTLCYEGGYPNPPAPTLSAAPGGSLGATTYYTRTTYVFASGEGPPSPEDNLAVAANSLLVVASPVMQTGATGYNVYAGASTGAETKQNASPIAIGTAWTEPTSGLISGTAPPPSETSYELVAYETANLISGSQYNLGTYLRRGMYGTTVGDHPAGSQFGRLDGSQMVIPYDKSQIGLTVYIKLLAFNPWGGGENTLAGVQPFQHTIQGPPLPGVVQNFSATQSGNAVAFGWTDLTDYALKGYDILYGPVSGAVGTATMLTEAARGTEMTNAAIPPGTWVFYIRGHDIADQLGPVSQVTLVVTNSDSLISQVAQEPSWLGTLSERLALNAGGGLLLNSGQGLLALNAGAGFVAHYTGILIPQDQNLAGYYTTLSAPAAPTLGAVSGGALGLATYYVKVTYVDAFGETAASPESSQLVPALSLLTVASPAATPGGNQPATGYNVYVAASSGAETLQNAAPLPIGSTWTEPASGLITGVSPPTLNTTGWELFDMMTPNPVATATYIAPTADTGYNATLRVYASSASALGTGQSGAIATLTLSIDTWLTGATDPNNYVDWTIGFTTLRYLNAALTYSGIARGNVSYITDFTPTVDTAPSIENNSASLPVIAQIITTGTVSGTNQLTSIGSMTGIVVGLAVTGANIPAGATVTAVNVGASSLTMSAAATGSASGEAVTLMTWVTFPTQYHSNPNVVVTPVSGAASSGTGGSATNITPVGFSPLVWNGTTNIAGTVNWQATGV